MNYITQLAERGSVMLRSIFTTTATFCSPTAGPGRGSSKAHLEALNASNLPFDSRLLYSVFPPPPGIFNNSRRTPRGAIVPF